MKTNWPIKKLGEVADVIMGQSPPSSTYNINKNGLPFYQGKVDFGELYPTPRIWCSRPIKITESDDVLISVRAPVGPTNLSKEKSCIGRGLAAMRSKPKELNFMYLLLYLRSIESNLSKRGSGTTFSAIGKKELENLEIPVPGIEEQKRIVSKLEKILAKISQASTLRRESEKETNQIMKVSVRKTLLSIKDSTELGSFCDVTKLAGFEFTKYVKYQENGEIIALRGLNIKNRGLDLSKIKYIPTETSSFLKRSKLEKDDLVMSYAGTLGSVAIIPDSNKFHCAPNVSKIRIKNKKELLPQFLLWCLDSGAVLEQINYLSKIAAQPSISMTNIRKIKIPLPDLKEQEKIEAYLDGLSEKVQDLQKLQKEQLQELEALQQSVLHQAFQGNL